MGETKTVKGRFDGKHVILFPGVGLDPAERRRRFLSALGSWDDARSTDEIMADIMGSRSMGREVPEL